MSFVLAAIDGTLSESSYNVGGNVSYVRRFHDNCQAQAKQYFAGPGEGPGGIGGIIGTDVDNIAQAAWQFLIRNLRRSPQAKVVLVGHSRGGHIAVALTRRLSGFREGDFTPSIRAPGSSNTNPQQKVHFLGLYDAVDMTWNAGDTSAITRNVTHFANAIRSPEVGSRGSWGNTGTGYMCSDAHRTRTFRATHGALGGAPSHSCETGPSLFGDSCNVALTPAENRRAGDEAHQFILQRARAAGLTV